MLARTSRVAGCTVGREPHYKKYRGRLLYKTAAAQYNAGAGTSNINDILAQGWCGALSAATGII